ncbi:hypothetical protein EFU51_00480 [Vibrio cholerae]|nr:hypothetical protein [Vibrio cholerae]
MQSKIHPQTIKTSKNFNRCFSAVFVFYYFRFITLGIVIEALYVRHSVGYVLAQSVKIRSVSPYFC